MEELKKVKSEIYGEGFKQEDGSTGLLPNIAFFFSRLW
jgi:hypothetical protein